MLTILALALQIASAPVVVNSPLKEKCVVRDTTINLPVIHYDSSSTLGTTKKTLNRRGLSYHYFIKRDGTVVRMLPPHCKADHAGVSYYNGQFMVNNTSIGICLQNVPPAKYTEKQYTSLAWLLKQLKLRWPNLDSAVGHSDVAIPRDRKKDPGKEFRWGYLDSLLKHVRVP